MKIVVADKIQDLDLAEEHLEQLRKLGEVVVHKDNPATDAELVGRADGADVLIMYGFVPLPGSVIRQLTTVKYIVAAAIGYNWIDVEAARAKQILVSNAPGHNSRAVAEYTIALMLSAVRKLKHSLLDIHYGIWNSDIYKGFELKGKKLALFGYGNIGKEIERIAALGFDMDVSHFNTKSTTGDLKLMLAEADIVVSSLPLNQRTQGFFSTDKFELMRDGVVFVNVGRGAVVDEAALLAHLRSGKISAAALDVLTDEVNGAASPFSSMANVVLTPHTAFNTVEAEHNLSRVLMENVLAFAQGKPINLVS